MKRGTLFLVPAALGDLKVADPGGTALSGLVSASLPPATVRIVQGLTWFAVENAKSARAFLKAAGIQTPIQNLSITEIGHAPKASILVPLIAALCDGRDIGLLSESGCPAVADPGAQLVRLAHEAGLKVAPLIGPSSLLLALMASGLDGQRFAFGGYLPIKDPERSRAIRDLETRSRTLRETQFVIETPFRNVALFEALKSTLQSETRLALAIDLSLPGETIVMKTIAEWRRVAAPALDRRQAVFLFLAN